MRDKPDFCKSFEKPDEKRDFKSNGHMAVLNFPDGVSIGRAIYAPGWKWANDVRPIAGTTRCEIPHSGYCVSGMMRVRLLNGDEFAIRAGDAFQIPPGHEAWVSGDEPCIMIDVTGCRAYGKKSA
jgi:hypothetical protein